ncbi:MAG: hypothetical protein ACJA1H_002804 [Glaciecola sp.]|jgi:hypothetical protein
MLHNQVGGYLLTVNYEFDAQGRLIKQTKNKLFFTS